MTKADLEILEANRVQIKRLKCRLRAIRTRSTVGAQKITGMPRGGGTGDPVANAGGSAADIEIELNDIQLKSMIIIKEVKNDAVHEVLDRYYVEADDIDEIASAMMFSSYQGAYSVLYRFKQKIQ